jgi:steroid 5-alpha reductase family enzyme
MEFLLSSTFGYSFLGLFIFFHLTFLLAIKRNQLSLVDIAYGLGFVVLAQGLFYQQGFFWIYLAVTLWGLRLGIYLFIRNFNKGEDYRYQGIKDKWKSHQTLNAYFKIYLFQLVLVTTIALPFTLSMLKNQTASLPIFLLGAGLFSFGFFWESWADYVLFQFKKQPANKGKILTLGPWKFSRHPNYFGEIVLWWGIYLMSGQYWHIYSPLLITYLILKFTGIPFLQKRFEADPEYKKYCLTTNKLIPKFF